MKKMNKNKKRVFLIINVLGLLLSETSFASNSFTDVSAGHWTYDSIGKLAAAGVIEGYGDDTFRGDRLMTRYEMAQIVAKAMAKGTNVDKLAAEFADELNALGVRVAKLEEDRKVKISGQIRYSNSRDSFNWRNNRYRQRLRTRLWINGEINDNWKYLARIENNQFFVNSDFNGTANDVRFKGEETTNWNVACLQGRLGGASIMAGREVLWAGDGNIYDGAMDGVTVDYGSKLHVQAYYGKPTLARDLYGRPMDGVWGGNLTLNTLNNKLKLYAEYTKFNTENQGDDLGLLSLAFMGELNNNFRLSTIYTKTYSNNALYISKGAPTSGFVSTLNYKESSYAKPGSFGVSLKYYQAAAGSAVVHTMTGAGASSFFTTGYKGYSIGVNYVIAKNMMLNITWYDLKDRVSNRKVDTLWSEMQLRF